MSYDPVILPIEEDFGVYESDDSCDSFEEEGSFELPYEEGTSIGVYDMGAGDEGAVALPALPEDNYDDFVYGDEADLSDSSSYEDWSSRDEDFELDNDFEYDDNDTQMIGY